MDYILIALFTTLILTKILVYLLNELEIINYPSSDVVRHIKEESSIIKTFEEHKFSIFDAVLIDKYFKTHYKQNFFNYCEIILIRKNSITDRLTYIFYFPSKNERLVITIRNSTIKSTHQNLELHKVIISKEITHILPPTVHDQLISIKNERFSEVSNITWSQSYVSWEAYADSNNVNIKHGKIIQIWFYNRDTNECESISI